MSLSRQRVSGITAGFADLNKARDVHFHGGRRVHLASDGTVVFSRFQGDTLGLLRLVDLSANQARPNAVPGTDATALSDDGALSLAG